MIPYCGSTNYRTDARRRTEAYGGVRRRMEAYGGVWKRTETYGKGSKTSDKNGGRITQFGLFQ